MTGRLDRFDDHLGICPACGKIRYRTRASARHAARRMSRRLRAYACGDYWHLTSQAAARITAYREYLSTGTDG